MRNFPWLYLALFFAGGAHATAQETAIFAGGCFWCMEPPYEKLKGVIAAESGYSGGHVKSPTYKQVSAGGTGHLEVVRVTYYPKQVTYAELLAVFWKNVDPLNAAGQFCDKGEQYTSAIFFSGPEQKRAAEESLAKITAKLQGKGKVATKLLPASEFFLAEADHQDYYKKNSTLYKIYRFNCGRDRRLGEVEKLLR